MLENRLTCYENMLTHWRESSAIYSSLMFMIVSLSSKQVVII